MTANEKKSSALWSDPDDAPAWSDEVFARAELREGEHILRAATGTLMRRGRPKLANPKQQVTLRLDGEILERFRADGPGWQRRINDALRRAAGL